MNGLELVMDHGRQDERLIGVLVRLVPPHESPEKRNDLSRRSPPVNNLAEWVNDRNLYAPQSELPGKLLRIPEDDHVQLFDERNRDVFWGLPDVLHRFRDSEGFGYLFFRPLRPHASREHRLDLVVSNCGTLDCVGIVGKSLGEPLPALLAQMDHPDPGIGSQTAQLHSFVTVQANRVRVANLLERIRLVLETDACGLQPLPQFLAREVVPEEDPYLFWPARSSVRMSQIVLLPSPHQPDFDIHNLYR